LIVAGGSRNNLNNEDFALVRYNPDGSLDVTFDGDGKVITAVSSLWDSAHAVAIQQDGKIVAAGFSEGHSFDFALARYDSDGSLDESEFNGGIVTTDIGSGYLNAAAAVAIQLDGKIVAVSSSANHFVVVRYNPDGSFDTTFNGDGKVITGFGSTYETARAVAIQADGKIVVAGFTSEGDLTGDFAIARFDPDGLLDSTFDSDGRVTTSISAQDDDAHAIAIQPNGKIVVAGYSRSASSFDFALVRYNPDGSTDATFDGDGMVTTWMGGGPANAVALQPDGKIVVAGMGWNAWHDFGVVRYNVDGSLDTTFDGDGKVFTDISGVGDWASAVAIQSDGKIVAAGSNSSYTDFALVRYNPNG
jgi:uncharacterized delta-60 repeat protein